MPTDTGMEQAPKVFFDMDGEFIDFVEGESLTVRFKQGTIYAPAWVYAGRNNRCGYGQCHSAVELHAGPAKYHQRN